MVFFAVLLGRLCSVIVALPGHLLYYFTVFPHSICKVHNYVSNRKGKCPGGQVFSIPGFGSLVGLNNILFVPLHVNKYIQPQMFQDLTVS